MYWLLLLHHYVFEFYLYWCMYLCIVHPHCFVLFSCANTSQFTHYTVVRHLYSFLFWTFVFGTGAWTRGLYLEPLYQPVRLCINTAQFVNVTSTLVSFLVVLGFEIRVSCLLDRCFYCLSHSTSPFFVMDFSKIGFLELFPQGWLWTVILLIPASWVARITGVNHWRLAPCLFLTLMDVLPKFHY
jgi:hypothetical protein